MAAQPLVPPIVPPGFRGREQTWRAYKRLLRFMHAGAMKPGDKLPPQAELRRLLGLNNSTLGGAMEQLVRQGAVVRKRRVGTVVANLVDVPPVAWSVGLASFPAPAQGPDSFFAELSIRAQTALARARCRCISYLRMVHRPAVPFTDFYGLNEDIQDENLDGLLTFTPLSLTDWRSARRRGIPIVHTPHWEDAPRGVLTDQGALVAQAIPMLKARGCRSLALVTYLEPIDAAPRACEAFNRLAREAGYSAGALELLPAMNWSVAGGHEIARALRARAAKRRPQGLIVLDDYTALGIAQALQESGDYSPQLALQANRLLTLAFPRPVLRFEADAEVLATRAVEMLLAAMQNPTLPERVEWVAPRLAEADAADFTLAPSPNRQADKPAG